MNVAAKETPADIASRLGISPKTLRAWLRERFWRTHVRYSRWYFSQTEANEIIREYRRD